MAKELGTTDRLTLATVMVGLPSSANEKLARYEWKPTSMGDPYADWVQGDWLAPHAVTDEEYEGIKAALPHIGELRRPAPSDTIREWIMTVGIATAGKQLSVDEVRIKAAVYAAMLEDFPVACFTGTTAKDAAQKFKWFPSVAEIAELLAPVRDDVIDIERHMRAMLAIHDAPPPAPPAPPAPKVEVAKPTAEELARVGYDQRERKPPEPWQPSRTFHDLVSKGLKGGDE